MSCPLTELGILLSSLPQFYVSARELSAVRACARVRVDGCSRVGDGGRKRRGAFRNCLSPMNGYCSETVLSVRPSVRPSAPVFTLRRIQHNNAQSSAPAERNTATDGGTERGRQSRKKRAPCSRSPYLLPTSLSSRKEGIRRREGVVP